MPHKLSHKIAMPAATLVRLVGSLRSEAALVVDDDIVSSGRRNRDFNWLRSSKSSGQIYMSRKPITEERWKTLQEKAKAAGLRLEILT